MLRSVRAESWAMWVCGIGAAAGIAAAGPLPSPASVPGKEYSHHQDEDFLGTPDFLQNIWWDGLGNATDAFDYTGSGGAAGAPIDPDQVDALANHQDFLFHPLINNQAAMLVSLDQPVPSNDIRSHDTGGNTAVWANAPTINSNRLPDQVDALEVWGTDADLGIVQHDGLMGFDANHFSIIGDALGPGISVFFYDPFAHVSSPYILHSQVVAAVGLTPVADQVDIDALMVYDLEGDRQWGPGDTILFSLRPIPGVIDGGEIWQWQFGLPAMFLNHGGRIWDTANPVGQIFGLPTENIDALEAVFPEPATAMILLAGGLLIMRRRS